MVRPCRAPALLAILALVACAERKTVAPTAQQLPPVADAQAAPSAAVGPADAGYEGPWLGATVLQAPVLSEMESERSKESKVVRLGYLRYGEKVPAFGEARRQPNCPEGWYELLAGGFVCGRYATLDLEHPKFRDAHAPDLESSLPYTYGANVANGTPLYRSVPSRAQRLKLEPWLVKPKRPKPADDDDPYAAPGPDAGSSDSTGDDDIPWWERETPDGGPPSVTLDDLQENEGPIERRMVKGFFLSLDRQFPAAGATWWRTVGGLITPVERIFVSKPVTEFHGVWLGKDDGSYATKNVAARRVDKLPVAFVMNGRGHRWTLDDSHKHPSTTDGKIDHFEAVGLTGTTVSAAGYEFWETDEGWWLRAIDATKTEPGPSPPALGEHEKWIDVNLKRQTLVAFEGQTPVFTTVVSSGRNEHETPTGTFRIREKHIAATMHADTATDGPYSIEDVPYIEYFNAGYALHGAFWHGAFGNVKSHGCVNLSPWDAKNVFAWTDPQLPEGWHGVLATKERPGTRVLVHGKGPGTCEGPDTTACDDQ